MIREIKNLDLRFEEKIDFVRKNRNQGFLDFNIINKNDITYIDVNTDNSTSLRDFKIDTATDLFHILIEVAKTTELVKENWCFIGSYIIDVDTVYLDEKNKKVRFCYMPNSKYYQEILTGHEYFLGEILITLMREKLKISTFNSINISILENYLDELTEILLKSKSDSKKIIFLLKKLRRKIQMWL